MQQLLRDNFWSAYIPDSTDSNHWDEELGQPRQERCCFPSHVCRDWSQYLLTAASIGSYGAGAYSYYSAATPLSYLNAVGLTLVGTISAIGAGRVWCLKPGNDLAKVTVRVADQYVKLSRSQKELMQSQRELEVSRSGLEAEVKQERYQNEQLEINFKRAKADIDNVLAELKMTKEEFGSLQILYERLKTTLNLASEKISDLDQVKAELKKKGSELKKENIRLEDSQVVLGDRIDKLDEHASKLDIENKELEILLSDFEIKLSKLCQTLTQIREERAHLQKLIEQVKILDESDDKFSQGSEKLFHLVEQLTAQNRELEEKVLKLTLK